MKSVIESAMVTTRRSSVGVVLESGRRSEQCRGRAEHTPQTFTASPPFFYFYGSEVFVLLGTFEESVKITSYALRWLSLRL
jgi:hypothetical protein